MRLAFILSIVKNLIVFKCFMRFVRDSILNTHYLSVLCMRDDLIAHNSMRMSTPIGSRIGLLDYAVIDTQNLLTAPI